MRKPVAIPTLGECLRGTRTWIATLLCCLATVHPASVIAKESADIAAQRMGAGVNILGYDGIWEGGTDAPFRKSYFGMIKRAGFQHVRINLYAFKYIDSNMRVDPNFLGHLDWVLDQVVSAGLVPVIDEHDFEVCQVDTGTCIRKLKAFWSEVSARYANRYPSAIYEILNEPGGNMDVKTWGSIVADVLSIIRRKSPQRTVVVAALNVEGDIKDRVPALPETDRNLIVTVHYYEPMRFTHQGASWAPEFKVSAPVKWGTESDKRKISDDFLQIMKWSKENRRPMYLGEFGAYDAAPLADRAAYIGFIVKTARDHGWPFAYWQFDHDFAIYDTDKEKWNAAIVRAIFPR